MMALYTSLRKFMTAGSRPIRHALMAAVIVAALTLPGSAARAQTAEPEILCTTCNCPVAFALETARQVSAEHNLTRLFFGYVFPIPTGFGLEGSGEIGEHQRFLIEYLFRGIDDIGGILPAWMLMTQQLTAVMMQQMQIVGTFLDAKHELESQQIYREMVARAHKAYHPGMGMCVIGTNVRSLGASTRISRLTSAVMARRGVDRMAGGSYSLGANGPVDDISDRMTEFLERYCDFRDNNFVDGVAESGLSLLCAEGSHEDRIPTLQTDIDYGRTLDLPRTINVTFNMAPGSVASNDERAVFELSSNLYGHKVFNRLSHDSLRLIGNHDDYQDMRALIAKRSVVQNSFNNIVGMKAKGSLRPLGATPPVGGSNDTSAYMRHFLRELGVLDDVELRHLLADFAATSTEGTIIQPSYYAQMEILAKRLYQDPNFFTGLYESPANVKRKSAALQAIGLMLERDMYNSQTRSEMLMSQLLEIRVARAQRRAETNNRLMSPIEEGN
jgi:hypothetical protein